MNWIRIKNSNNGRNPRGPLCSIYYCFYYYGHFLRVEISQDLSYYYYIIIMVISYEWRQVKTYHIFIGTSIWIIELEVIYKSIFLYSDVDSGQMECYEMCVWTLITMDLMDEIQLLPGQFQQEDLCFYNIILRIGSI